MLEQDIFLGKDITMKRSIKIGKRIIPLWLVLILLLSGVVGGVLANYIWTSIIISLEVEEPLKILSYPKKLKLYPGDTKEFNVTVKNSASQNYTVILDFSLDNTTYQDSYVTFSNETYTVISDEQNLTAWLQVEEYAPPIDASLTIDFRRIGEEEEESEVLFFDGYDDGVADGWTVKLGNFEVIDGEYYTENDFGEKSITIVDDLTCTDCTVEVNLRLKDTEGGFQGAIVFRYTDNEYHYTFGVNAQGDCVSLEKYTPGNAHFGELLAVNYSVSINLNTDYLVGICIQGNTFTGFLNGEEVLSVTDDAYTIGQVGLRGQKADIYFDNFTVYSTP